MFPLRTCLRNHGLTLVLCLLFLGSWCGQALAGWCENNSENREHGQPQVTLPAYLVSGHFLEATGENWESEFLQMGLFVVLTTFLFQKGSPESHDPDEGPPEEPPVTRNSPWPVRAGGLWRVLYRYSLGSAFALLFVLSFALHAGGGLEDYNQERREHGEAEASYASYVLSSRFWFESFQNWQSEFLSLAAMVYLSVYLRHEGSAESKPVATPHDESGG